MEASWPLARAAKSLKLPSAETVAPWQKAKLMTRARQYSITHGIGKRIRAAFGSAARCTAPVGVESIIGADQRKRVNPTTTLPGPRHGIDYFRYAFRFGHLHRLANRKGHGGDGGSLRRVRQRLRCFRQASCYRIYPGRNGTSAPYGSCSATQLFSVIGWTSSGDERFDYGAIKLNCNIGNTVGWYGFFWQSASLAGLPVITQGYPGDKPLTQWRSTDVVRGNTADQVFYRADTVGGQSGSPVWYNRSDQLQSLLHGHSRLRVAWI